MTQPVNLDAAVERLLSDLQKGHDRRAVGDPVRDEFAAHIDTVTRLSASNARAEAAEEALRGAREAFLNMVVEAKRWEFETDGDADDDGRPYSWTTVEMVVDKGPVEELCDALGMTGPHDEWIEDRITRYVEMPVARTTLASMKGEG